MRCEKRIGRRKCKRKASYNVILEKRVLHLCASHALDYAENTDFHVEKTKVGVVK